MASGDIFSMVVLVGVLAFAAFIAWVERKKLMSIIVNPELRGAALAQATAEYITEHPEEWDQNTWGEGGLSCGTRACFGGTACIIAGEAALCIHAGWPEFGHLDFTHDPGERSFSDVAQELLGIDRFDRESLFFGDWEFNTSDYGDVDRNTPTQDRIRNLWAKMVELYGDEITVPEEYKR